MRRFNQFWYSILIVVVIKNVVLNYFDTYFDVVFINHVILCDDWQILIFFDCGRHKPRYFTWHFSRIGLYFNCGIINNVILCGILINLDFILIVVVMNNVILCDILTEFGLFFLALFMIPLRRIYPFSHFGVNSEQECSHRLLIVEECYFVKISLLSLERDSNLIALLKALKH